MGISPFRSGPLPVLNKYQVAPSRMMAGSWTNSTSPLVGMVREAVGDCCVRALEQPRPAASRQTRNSRKFMAERLSPVHRGRPKGTIVANVYSFDCRGRHD